VAQPRPRRLRRGDGSKKLKGVVFHGDRKVEAARPDEFKALVKDMAVRAKDDPGVAAYRRGGTVNMVRLINGITPSPRATGARATSTTSSL